MKLCETCGIDISYKTSNNVKRCERCARKLGAQKSISKIIKRTYTIGMVKHKVLTLYSKRCAICNWRATEELLTVRGKSYPSYGCEIHHIEKVSNGGGESINNLILLCPNHHKQADLNIISKEELRAYQIAPEGVVDEFTLKREGAELLDTLY